MYETLSELRRKHGQSFDIVFETKTQVEQNRLCFMLPGRDERAVSGVWARIIWDATAKNLNAVYVLPRKLGGLVVGMGPCVYDVRPDSSGFDVVAVAANAYEPTQAKLVLGTVAQPVSESGALPPIRMELDSGSSSEFILSEHLDFIIGNSINKRV